MGQLTQAQLQQKLEILIKNGRLPEGAAILAEIGYGPEDLDQVETMLAEWIAGKARRQVLKSDMKRATARQNKAFNMAYPEMKRLKQIAENRFRNNDPALTQLGLKSRRTAATAATTTSETADGRDETAVIDQDATTMETNGSETNSTETSTTRKYKTQSKSLGAYLARWRMLYTNISTLTEAEQGQLTKAKWTPERIDQAAALVEATAEADTAQKIHEHAYQVQCDRVRAQLANLRDWYRDLLGLLKPALDGIEDMEKARYKTLFDL